MIFTRVLFSRNFPYAKFRENKVLAKISEFTVFTLWIGHYLSSLHAKILILLAPVKNVSENVVYLSHLLHIFVNYIDSCTVLVMKKKPTFLAFARRKQAVNFLFGNSAEKTEHKISRFFSAKKIIVA